MASQKAPGLPGFSLPLNFAPRRGFPSALQCEDLGMDVGRLNVHRDIVMMRIINAITEKPDWHSKVCKGVSMTTEKPELTLGRYLTMGLSRNCYNKPRAAKMSPQK